MKKGFTLVELLCVIVIIAIISLITFPKIARNINNAKEELYLSQVKNMEKAGERWAIDNKDYLDKYHINDVFITLDLLKETKYLEKEDILSPKDKKVMNGCILISYSENKYDYKYIELDCKIEENYDSNGNSTISFYHDTVEDNIKEYSDSYIIYDYNIDTAKIITLNRGNVPAYQTILNNNNLCVLGEKCTNSDGETSGLYDLENEYVFRGTTVNNYVKYEGNEWRIISIDKNDYSMKLMSTKLNQDTLSSITATAVSDFTKTDLQATLSDNVSEYSKLVDKWGNGIIEDVDNKTTSIRNIIEKDSIYSKAAILSVYDYVMASADSVCEDNFRSKSCANDNYIATMFNGKEFWTMNTNGSKFWYVNTDDELKLSDSNSGPYYYSTVIKVPVNVYLADDIATGTSGNPYELK